jgi:predicted nucleic acid-binding protein
VAGVVVVDASVLVAHLDEHDVHHSRAVEHLLDLADHPLAASPVTIAEVLVGPAQQGRLPAARAALDDLGLVEVPLSPDAAVRLAVLRAETKLKLPDCCVILAAQIEVAGILSFDDQLGERASALGLEVVR